MVTTNFPDGITSFGVPIVGGSLPPFTGNYFWVNETTGSDGNTGAADNPFKTLTQALSQCQANNNDVVLFTGTIHLTSTLAWNKNQVHLVGLDAPLKRGKRARISSSGATAFAPLVDVTGSGCWFQTFGTFYGFNSASNNTICWKEEGGRNCYDLVEFLGFGDGTASTGTANITGARALLVSGNTGENTFRSCVLGVDTTTRNATNATLEFTGGSPRNYFIGCDFEMSAGSSGAAASHVYTAGAAAIDRYAKFENCTFNNAIGSGATTINQVFSLAASAGGYFDLSQCRWIGATHLETTASNQIYIDMSAPSNSTGGHSVNNTTS